MNNSFEIIKDVIYDSEFFLDIVSEKVKNYIIKLYKNTDNVNINYNFLFDRKNDRYVEWSVIRKDNKLCIFYVKLFVEKYYEKDSVNISLISRNKYLRSIIETTDNEFYDIYELTNKLDNLINEFFK